MHCKHILVVEDEAGLRETIRDLLELEGFRVSTAANGQEALDELREGLQSCLILLDLMMPVMNGWQFLEVLNNEHQQVMASIPIVVVSAAADVVMAEQQYGCRVMRKPASIDKLVALAHEYCANC